MGWKTSTLIIHQPSAVDYEQLLNELGYQGLTKIEDAPFEVAHHPEDDTVYIGSYKDNLLICAPDIPMQFFDDQKSAALATLYQRFPNAEICSIILHSSVNLWGYSVHKNGQLIRVRAGNADQGTFKEWGEPLDEEQALLSTSIRNKKGERMYPYTAAADELLTEDQVGEQFVFDVCKRYFGEALDQADGLLFETTLQGYSFTHSVTPKPLEKKQSKWLRYGLLFLIILIIQLLQRTVFKK